MIRTLRIFSALLVVGLVAQLSFAASSYYHHNVTVGRDGRPALQLTNDSDLPIMAFFMVEFPSLGMEGRTYYDFYLNQRELPIAPHESITRGLSSFKGAEGKVRAEVRAVIFQDGSTAGDPVWVNAILARRLRFYDRVLSIHDLLRKEVGTGQNREGVAGMLRAAQREADKQLPEDDLRVMDDSAFYGAISTIDSNRQASLDDVLNHYLAYLELRVTVLERSRPVLDTVRGKPISIPKPLSDDSLPPEFRAARAAIAAKEAATPGGTLASCSVFGAQFSWQFTPLDPCTDSEGNGSLGYTSNQYTLVTSDDALSYTNSAGQISYPKWSWSPGPNGMDMATGQCKGFYDCDGNWDVFYVPQNGGKGAQVNGAGAATFGNITTVEQGQNAKSFWWLYDNYPSPTFSGCDACDPYPNNEENPQSVNAPIPGVTFYFSYDCSVTPN